MVFYGLNVSNMCSLQLHYIAIYARGQHNHQPTTTTQKVNFSNIQIDLTSGQ